MVEKPLYYFSIKFIVLYSYFLLWYNILSLFIFSRPPSFFRLKIYCDNKYFVKRWFHFIVLKSIPIINTWYVLSDLVKHFISSNESRRSLWKNFLNSSFISPVYEMWSLPLPALNVLSNIIVAKPCSWLKITFLLEISLFLFLIFEPFDWHSNVTLSKNRSLLFSIISVVSWLIFHLYEKKN